MAKILLVDDDALMVRMYQKKFIVDGYEVDTADNVPNALEKVAKVKPDLILLDIMMPGESGLDMLAKLKKNSATKHVPVILLTNLGGSETDVENGLSLGAVAYLIKANYTPKEIVQKVKEILAAYNHELPKVHTTIREENK